MMFSGMRGMEASRGDGVLTLIGMDEIAGDDASTRFLNRGSQVQILLGAVFPSRIDSPPESVCSPSSSAGVANAPAAARAHHRIVDEGLVARAYSEARRARRPA